MSTRWPVEWATGPAAVFHARPVPEPPTRRVWVFRVDRPALVLGSTQCDDVVDRAAAHAAGVEVVWRRSGGGAVLLTPGGSVWIDVVLPPSDRLWCDDVGRSFDWLGRAWAAALGDLGLVAEVHEGASCTTTWSRLACFAGLGPGEVTVGGRKAVGLSQRRGRGGARFQGAVLRRWEPDLLLSLLALGDSDRAAASADLADAVATVDRPAGDVVKALLRNLPT